MSQSVPNSSCDGGKGINWWYPAAVCKILPHNYYCWGGQRYHSTVVWYVTSKCVYVYRIAQFIDGGKYWQMSFRQCMLAMEL